MSFRVLFLIISSFDFSKPQQYKIAKYCEEVFGEFLLKEQLESVPVSTYYIEKKGQCYRSLKLIVRFVFACDLCQILRAKLRLQNNDILFIMVISLLFLTSKVFLVKNNKY